MVQSNLKTRRPLFWDINENDIEKALIESNDWVIVRVFQYGELEDIFDVIELYGKEKVTEVLLKTNLRPMAAAMAFLFLDIDPTKKYAA